jgi:tetratricopeptide (TPR) repeat protein
MTKFNGPRKLKRKESYALRRRQTNSLLLRDKAVKSFEDGHYKEAIFLFSELLRILPSYSKAYHNRGLAYSELGDYRKAFADFDKSRRLDRKNSRLSINRAFAYSRMGAFCQAIQEYNKYCKADPDFSLAYLERGKTFFKMGKFANARKDLFKAIKLDPGNKFTHHEPAYLYLSMIFYKKGDHKRANEYFNRAKKLESFSENLVLVFDGIWQFAKDGFFPALEYLYKNGKLAQK